MNEPAPTRQQRDIIDSLTRTLDTFDPAQVPYADGPAPQAPAGRRACGGLSAPSLAGHGQRPCPVPSAQCRGYC